MIGKYLAPRRGVAAPLFPSCSLPVHVRRVSDGILVFVIDWFLC